MTISSSIFFLQKCWPYTHPGSMETRGETVKHITTSYCNTVDMCYRDSGGGRQDMGGV